MDAAAPFDDDARVPFSTVLLSVVGLWLTYFVLTTLRWELLDLGFSRELLWPRALASLAGVGVTIAFWLVLRLFDARPLWAKIAAALLLSLPVAVSLALTNRLVMADLERQVVERLAVGQRAAAGDDDMMIDLPGMSFPQPADPATTGAKPVVATAWQDITELVFGRYFMMLAWSALYLALLTGEKARAAERREGTYRRAAKAAELRSLRYQVNPHFLFNTLNSLSALVLTGKTQAAEKVIQTLATFYRRSLADDPTADVPLREEFALQRLYLEIEAIRFPRRLKAVFELPAELEDVCVPGMILQPLVENSVKHAVAPSVGRVTVRIAAHEEYERLVITVANDGAAGSTGTSSAGHGIGLANVRDRLAARYGDAASVVSGPAPDGYTTQLRLPLLRLTEIDS
jgi:two-component system LytT family sensor kinase